MLLKTTFFVVTIAFCGLHLALCTIQTSDRASSLVYNLYPEEELSIQNNTSSIKTKAIKVQDNMDCVFECVGVRWCKSVNFWKTHSNDGLHVCQLLSADSFTNKQNMTQNKAGNHYSVKNPCKEKPCENGGECKFQENRQNYTCTCTNGFQGQQCETDINECTSGSHSCHANAICTNTVGSYTCQCNPGYTGDGRTCSDINECTSGSHSCHANAICTNTVGSYTCQCKSGYQGDGFTCTMLSSNCQGSDSAVGLETRAIPDSSLTASSVWDANREPKNGRLKSTYCWAPRQGQIGQWMQVDLGQDRKITRMATQGEGSNQQYCKTIKIQYSTSGITSSSPYVENGKIFNANTAGNHQIEMLLLVFVTLAVVSIGQCQFLMWTFDIVKDHALQGHVIKSLSLHKPDCMSECQQVLMCFSLNVYKASNGSNICELNRSTKTQSPTSFSRREGYEYAEPRQGKFCTKDKCITDKDALPNMVFKFNSSLFQLVTVNKTWQEARQHCQTLGGDLASISSDMENKFIFALIDVWFPKVIFGDKENYLAQLKMNGKDAEISLYDGARYKPTNKGVAIYFDGINDFATCPRFKFFDRSFTFGAWIKLSQAKVHHIINQDNGMKLVRTFNFKISNDGLLTFVLFFPKGNIDERWLLSSKNAVPTNQWTHIAFTFDINTHVGSIYINGSFDTTGNASVTSKTMTNYVTSTYIIGKVSYSYLSTGNFAGWMNDMIMIDRVLDRTEIKALVEGERRAWVGVSDIESEGTFEWSNGLPLTHEKLHSFNSDIRDCGAMSLVEEFQGDWRMRNCQQKSFFICKI